MRRPVETDEIIRGVTQYVSETFGGADIQAPGGDFVAMAMAENFIVKRDDPRYYCLTAPNSVRCAPIGPGAIKQSMGMDDGL
jgi:hypothetical protein